MNDNRINLLHSSHSYRINMRHPSTAGLSIRLSSPQSTSDHHYHLSNTWVGQWAYITYCIPSFIIDPKISKSLKISYLAKKKKLLKHLANHSSLSHLLVSKPRVKGDIFFWFTPPLPFSLPLRPSQGVQNLWMDFN